MKNLKVKKKFMILIIITGIIMIAMGVSSVLIISNLKNKSVDMLKTSIQTEYDAGIKQEVNTAISICKYYEKQIEDGKLDEDTAKTLAAGEIRDIRYSDTGYFWVDTYDGVNVVLLGGDMEGKNRLSTKDVNGFAMVNDFIEGAKKNPDEGYFNEYYFPKEGETEPSPKRAYTKVFEPFNWVIGTGNYIDYIDDDVAAKDAAMTNIVRGVFILLLVMLCGMTAFILIYVISFEKSILTPLSIIDDWLGKMKEGDFSIRMLPEYKERKDDFGHLMRSTEQMRESVEKMLGMAQSTASEVGASASRLSESAADTKTTSQGITSAIEDISKGASSQADSVQEGAEAISSILENVNSLTNAVDTADESAEKMAGQSEEMRTNFNKLSEAMNKTKESLDDVSSKVQMMGDSVSEVVQAVTSINAISAQTNLLSLNASIEAARAGEAGRGFAVVATEIQELSVQSANSAKQIGDIMDVLSKNSDVTVSTVEDLKASVDEQQNISDATRQAAHEVVEIIGQVRDIFAKAKDSCVQTRDRCGDLNDTMSSLSAISEENAASSEETSASMTQVNDTVVNIEKYSSSLNEIAGKLTDLLSVFKVSGEAGAGDV